MARKFSIYKPSKTLKNSKKVREFFKSKNATQGIIPYKGGMAAVVDSRIKEIFVGPNALKNIKKKYK